MGEGKGILHSGRGKGRGRIICRVRVDNTEGGVGKGGGLYIIPFLNTALTMFQLMFYLSGYFIFFYLTSKFPYTIQNITDSTIYSSTL